MGTGTRADATPVPRRELPRRPIPRPISVPTTAGAAPDSGTAASPLEPLAEAVPTGPSLAFYLHVPFCVQRCHYCSFNTAPLEEPGLTARWVEAVRVEIGLLAGLPLNAARPALTSVFFGGGTPSLLDPDEVAAVLDALARGFRLAADAEITLEANPEGLTAARLAGYRAAGINRLSLGVQSLDDALLAVLGRRHDAAGARAAFAAARAAGFDNVSVDLMYGLPGLDPAGWRRTLDAVLDWGPDHLSAYGLTLEAGSRWGAGAAPALPDEDTTVAQYRAVCAAAAERGFEHYEISNWARPGRRSRHNQTYWRRGEYLAAGPGACGFVGDLRWSDARAFPRWRAALERRRLPVETWERLTPRQALAETLILGLRTADGVPARQLAERAADDPALARRLEIWRAQGLLVEAAGRVRLTEAGFLLSDALFVALL
jgi:oxygen-independent coproporphyrinogen-3 oxidase